MYLPEYLFFEPKQLKEQLTTQFTGDLEVPIALQNNPCCWKKQVVLGEKHKKTIVLSDFRFENKGKNAEKLKEIINALLAEGFTVYLWQKKGPLELTSGLLHLDLTLTDCPPAHPKEIASAMAQKKIASESLLVMNVKDLETLGQEIEAQKPLTMPKPELQEIALDDILKSTYSFEKIKQAIPNFQLIDSPDPETEKVWWLKHHLDPVKMDYSDFKIKDKKNFEQYAKVSTEVKRLDLIVEKYSSEREFKKDPVSFKQLLITSPQLSTLKINSLDFIDIDLDEESGPFKSLEILDLSDIRLGSLSKEEEEKYSRLIYLAPHCLPNLKKIVRKEVNNFNNIIEELNTGSDKYADLSSFHLLESDMVTELIQAMKQTKMPTSELHIRCPIKLDELFEIIKNLPNLNFLELNHVTSQVATSDFKLSSLKGVKFSITPIEVIVNLLSIAPILDNLAVNKEISFMERVSCRALNKLQLYFLEPNKLQHLLSLLPDFSPNLHLLHINLVDLKKLSSQVILPASISPLLYLKQMHISTLLGDEELSKEVLEAFLKLAPNLEKLNLLRVEANLGAILLAKNQHIRSLEARLPFSFKATWSLASLLHQLPNLEVLTLEALPKKDDVFYSLQDLPNTLKLKNLSLDSFGDVALLVEILSRSPDLTDLSVNSLKGCNFLLTQLVKSGVTLPELKRVCLNQSDLTLEDYQLLKLIAPNLTKLDIKGSPISTEKALKEETAIYVSGIKEPQTLTQQSKSIGKNAQQTTHQIDANTGLDKHKFEIPKVFSNRFGKTFPEVSYYRNSVFNTLTFSDDTKNPFQLSNQGDLNLEPYQNYQYGEKPLADLLSQERRKIASNVLLGQHEMILSHQWTALPSAFAKEALRAIHVNGLEQHEIEIQYSKRDNLYYIRKTTPGVRLVKVDYVIDPHFPETKLTHPGLADWVKYFNTFGSGQLEANDLKSEALLNKMNEQKVGRCDQRAIMFKYLVQKQYPDLPVRIITNDCHAFVEVMQNGQWLSYCLGGYPADLTVKEPAATRMGEILANTVKPLPQTPIKVPVNEPLSVEALKRARQVLVNESLAPPDPHHITWQQKGQVQMNADALSLQALAAVEIDVKTGEQHGKNVLIQCESDSDVHTLSLNLQHMAKHTKRPFFVIDNPSQISCGDRWLKRNANNTGTNMPGPGGPLHAFLTEHKNADPPPVLIVNWNNFSSYELVRFNTLIDETRIADNTPLPKSMVVVGLYNTKKPEAYTGSDFYSRQQVKLTVDTNTISHERFSFNISEGQKAVDAIEIELYDSVNWQYILLGQWTLEAGKLIFKEGQLTQAIKEGRSVHLRNAPWHLPAFKQFWQQAQINGSITVEGETLPIFPAFWDKLNQGKGYDWQAFIQNINFLENLTKQPPHVVNSNNFKQWVDHYDIHEGKPVASPSLFSKYQNQRVDLLISEPLSTATWHQLLKAANRWKINLNLALPPQLSLPSSLTQAIPVSYLKEKVPTVNQVHLIATNDVSMSQAQLTYDLAQEKPLVIDITECTESDLLYRITASFKDDDMLFNERWSDVFKALQNKKTVILKGHFSKELINALLPLSVQGGMTVNGTFHQFQGKLILLSDQILSGAIVSEQKTHTINEKLNWVLTNMPDLSSDVQKAIKDHHWPEKFSLAQIQGTILHYLRTSPPSFELHEGILKVNKVLEPPATLDLREEHVNKVCNAFIQDRMARLNTILSSAPFAFIGGKTGVGKSSFMSRYITPDNGFTLYNEMTELDAWASDHSPGTKVLFLDEANIANKEYTLFEALYENPPVILVNDKLITLTPNHKVVFAGNPMNYGGERHLPCLLAEHGNACQFNLLPVEYVYREVLKPIFAAANIPESQARAFSQAILKTYQYICANSEEEILISPRELKMMAMMIISSSEQQSESIIYEVAKQCLPDEKKNAFHQWFISEFPKAITARIFVPPTKVTTGKKFVLTPSREPIYHSLQRLLHVRDLTQQSKQPALQSPGLGGMLLEGEAGSGKSHFIIDALMQQGYNKIPLDQVDAMMDNPPNKGFYVIPVNAAYSEKKRILLAAFNQGVPVVIDEINSSPMMEQLLNALLMGVHPDTKQGPKHPGFLLLATQNPIFMAGRQATSRAIARRILFHEFHPYDENEMKMILTELYPNVGSSAIEEQIKHHVQAIKYAKMHHLEPAPVFRDLHHIISEMDKTIERQIASQKKTVLQVATEASDALSDELLVAAEKDQINTCLTLLEKGADPNHKDKYGATSLHRAVKAGHKDLCSILLGKNANPNLQDNAGFTPLHDAAADGFIELCLALLENGADPNLQNKYGETPLSLLKALNHDKINQIISPEARIEEKRPAAIQISDKKELLSIKTLSEELLIAAEQGKQDICLTLLEKGADPNHKDKYGATSLHRAVKKGHKALCSILLEKGANPNLQDNAGDAPIYDAVTNGFIEICLALLENGADPNLQNKYGETPLSFLKELNNNDINQAILRIEFIHNVRMKMLHALDIVSPSSLEMSSPQEGRRSAVIQLSDKKESKIIDDMRKDIYEAKNLKELVEKWNNIKALPSIKVTLDDNIVAQINEALSGAKSKPIM